MPKLPVLKPKEVLRALQSVGFYIHHQRGSHARLLHDTCRDLRVTIPMHNKDLPEKTLRSILRQAGLSGEKFCRAALIPTLVGDGC
jgi:predicted RNA binding protein YcfA (HicA-like mRNA interferase family)